MARESAVPEGGAAGQQAEGGCHPGEGDSREARGGDPHEAFQADLEQRGDDDRDRTQDFCRCRSARLSSSVVISTSNISRASPTDLAYSTRTVASRVARLREYGCRRSVGACASSP